MRGTPVPEVIKPPDWLDAALQWLREQTG